MKHNFRNSNKKKQTTMKLLSSIKTLTVRKCVAHLKIIAENNNSKRTRNYPFWKAMIFTDCAQKLLPSTSGPPGAVYSSRRIFPTQFAGSEDLRTDANQNSFHSMSKSMFK